MNTNRLQQQQNASENERPMSTSLPCISQFHFILMNSSTSKNSLNILLTDTCLTNIFTLSTQLLVDKQNDFLIKIELLHPGQSYPFDVLLFFTHNSPGYNDGSFSKIQSILKLICLRDNRFYGWNFNKEHLSTFVRTGYLSQMEIDHITIIDLQDRFKQWYNKTFKHENNCPISSIPCQADDPSCICRHRPYKDRTDKWTIGTAFKRIFSKPMLASDQTNRSLQWKKYYYSLFHQTALNTFLVIMQFNSVLAQLNRYKQSRKR